LVLVVFDESPRAEIRSSRNDTHDDAHTPTGAKTSAAPRRPVRTCRTGGCERDAL